LRKRGAWKRGTLRGGGGRNRTLRESPRERGLERERHWGERLGILWGRYRGGGGEKLCSGMRLGGKKRLKKKRKKGQNTKGEPLNLVPVKRGMGMREEAGKKTQRPH